MGLIDERETSTTEGKGFDRAGDAEEGTMGARALRVVRNPFQGLLTTGKVANRNPSTAERDRRVSLLHFGFD